MTIATDQLFYISAATRPFDEQAVRSILETARRKNPLQDITGCLLYSGLYFGQVLEARPEVISGMIETLSRDTRHTAFKVLARERIVARTYGSWSMGYMHSLDMQDALRTLISQEPADPALVESTRRAIRPDPLTGMV